MNLSDIEIEVLLFGKWRFNTDWEKISIEFKDDMTYEQSRIQTFILSKPRELITGNKFNGVWYVNDGKLCLILKTVPKSFLNLQLAILPKVFLADMVVSIASLFLTEKYELTEINNSKFIIKDEQQPIVATKIK
ncbi:hypothetical protein NIES2100_25840 [Calothrix sp. NIES-2100]|uniref:hypothetical protein n=1 Tax=Calothrix sp. NIES-2100 TaxID=1954172 RepID=UPI000B60DBD1|nr:hypothetical protein NIES2100_25840 [Calothrix sp. NIES-2100]